MKRLTFLLCQVLVLASCSERPTSLPPGFEEKTVCLVDSFPLKTLAFVKLAVPDELDTLLKWTDASDCSYCCSTDKYRFVSSGGCLIQESATLVEGGFIVFRWECAGFENCGSFIQKAMQALASIQIDNTFRQ